MRCEDIERLVPGTLDGSRPVDRRTIRHVGSCLQCQAELARYHGTLRRLHALRTQRPELPPGLVGDVLAALEEAATRRTVRSVLTGRRLAYAGGAVVGGAVVAGTVVLSLGRGRSRGSLGTSELTGGSLSHRPCDRLAVRGMAIDRGQ